MTPAQQATAELHAAFWDVPYTNTLVALTSINSKLPRRAHNLMTAEAKELQQMKMYKAPKGHGMGKGKAR